MDEPFAMYHTGVSGQTSKRKKHAIGAIKHDPTAHLQGNNAPFIKNR
jgi:hypothetical protein